MLTANRFTAFLAGGLLGLGTTASAQDIDLFMTAGAEAASPNVLIIIDNSANWNADIGGITQETMNRGALTSVLTQDDDLLGEIRVGLTQFSRGNQPRGGKILSHVRLLDEAYQTDLAWLLDKDNEGDRLGEDGPGALRQTNNAPYAMTLHESYLYFGGKPPHSGTQDGDHDPAAISGSVYNSPAVDNCGRNYVIVIGNGAPDSGEDNPAESRLSALGGVRSDDPISLDPSNFESNWSDEFARFMAGTDVVPDSIREGNQNVISYVIDVYNPDVNQTRTFRAARAWMRSIARWGDGRYFAAHSEADIRAALKAILEELLAVNSVFASSTLPVSVNVRGTNLNQVYMGVFRPDTDSRTRWMGNLKLYQLQADSDTGTLFLADRDGNRADSPTTGFITSTATSFWTTGSDYWAFDPRGTPPSESDAPDGEVVEKGGAGQRQREAYENNLGSRQVFTCTGADCGPGARLANFPLEESHLDADLIDWVRGANNAEDPDDEDTRAEDSNVRPSIHGDVLHSRPAVVNMEGSEDSDVYVFYGANDGHFRAIQGGRGDGDGVELWSFIPEEFLDELDALRQNDETGTDNKRYFVDGSIGQFREREGVAGATEDRIWLFPSMRRGGRLLYALDVTDPHDPRLLWRRSHEDPGFGELGQTWSMPTPTRICDPFAAECTSEDYLPVVIFGAGYDAEIEDQGITDASRTMGRGIFVVNAETGDLIWQAGPESTSAPFNTVVPDMQYSIPSDPTILDTNDNGRADRIYVGDTGGNVWRVDIHDPDPSNWAVHHMAAFGLDQKFLYRPDVVYSKPEYDAVLIGSGNREDPFDTEVTNHFYMIKDYARGLTGGGDTRYDRSDLYDATDNLIQDGTEDQQIAAANELADADGWFIRMENPGEKVVTNATTVNKTTFFNTSQPPPADPGSCVNNLGIARNYMVDFSDATATQGPDNLSKRDRFKEAVGGGFPPSPVPVVVEIDGRYYEAVISGTQVHMAPGDPLDHRFRIWWNKQMDEVDG